MKKFNLHHMNPSSRSGETNEFNLFPYKARRHESWHKIFLNMKISEVWDNLEIIHSAIFDNDEERMNRHWLTLCKLPSATDLRNQVNKEYETEHLRESWECAFGGRELSRANAFLKHMMLFMVFGSSMANPEQLFDNGNLTAFFEKFPVENEREWAFAICFGVNANLHTIKAKMSKIIRKSP
ncbi:MAG: hypothetical protein WD989_00960 [Candidatus Paceibacterota bacterium]